MAKNVFPYSLLFIFFIAYFLVSLPYYSGDIKNHLAWGRSIAEFGTYGFFERTFPGFSYPTYPPLISAFFALSYVLYAGVMLLIHFLNQTVSFFPSGLVWFLQWENMEIAFLKLAGIIPVMLLAICISLFWRLFKDEVVLRDKYLIWLAVFLNPAIIYLAGVWGQTDVLQIVLMLFSFYFLFKKRVWMSAVFAGLALLSKQTVLIIFGVYLLSTLKLFGIKKMLGVVLISAGVFYLGYLPFYGLSLDKPVVHYFNSIRLVDFGVAENAVNLWGAMFNFKDASSNQKFFSIPLDFWGYLMFLILVAPLTLVFWFRRFDYEKFFQYLFLIFIIYFFVFTRMHERYLIPAVIFSTVLLLFKKRIYLINFVFFSLLHFINLYRGLYQPEIPIISQAVRSNEFLTILVVGYLVLIIYNYYLYVKDEIKKV